MDNYYYVHRYDSSKRVPEFLGPKHVSVLQNKTLLQNSSVFCQHTLEFSICWANVLCSDSKNHHWGISVSKIV